MANTVRVRGRIPDYLIKSLTRDRIGIYKGVTTRSFKLNTTEDRSKLIDLNWLTTKFAPTPWDIPLTNASGQINGNGLFEITYEYEGLGPQTASGPDGSDVVFEIEGSMTQDPIETHPRFDKLSKTYGWDETNRQFSKTLPAGSDASASSGSSPNSNALAGTQDSSSKKNPFLGVDSWLVVGAIFRKTYAAGSIPSTIFDGIGTITAAPEGIREFKLPSGSKKRNWLKLAPKVSRRGSAVQISLEWMMSGPNGWLSDIYDAGQLNENPDKTGTSAK